MVTTYTIERTQEAVCDHRLSNAHSIDKYDRTET